jgi:hypothetical protein
MRSVSYETKVGNRLFSELLLILTSSRYVDLPEVTRVEAGSNTSTVALQVVGSDEKGTQCLGL